MKAIKRGEEMQEKLPIDRGKDDKEDYMKTGIQHSILKLKEFWHKFKHEKLGLTGLILLLFITSIAVTGNIFGDVNDTLLKGDAPPAAAPGWTAVFDKNSLEDQKIIDQNFNDVSATSHLGGFQFSQLENTNESYVNATTSVGDGQLTFNFMDTGKPVENTTSSVLPRATLVMSKSFKWDHERTPNGYDFHFDYKYLSSAFNESQLFASNRAYDWSFTAYIKRPGYSTRIMQRIIEEDHGYEVPEESWNSYGILWTRSLPQVNISNWESTSSNRPYRLWNAIFETFSNLEINFVAEFQFRTINMTQRSQGTFTIAIDNLFFLCKGYYTGIFGTTVGGGDLFALTAKGIINSFFIGIFATFVMLFLGVFLGLVSGYHGGKTDEVIMRTADFLMALPNLPIMIVLTALLWQMEVGRVWGIILVIALMSWAKPARLLRSQVLSEREKPYIEAAKASGVPRFQIMIKHVLPNVIEVIIFQMVVNVRGIIIITAGLSFFGLGPKNWVSFGNLIHHFIEIKNMGVTQAHLFAREGVFLSSAWWIGFFPGLIFFLFLLGLLFISVTFQKIYQLRNVPSSTSS